jgi:hypothetical protein
VGNGEIRKRELWFEKSLVILEGLEKLICKSFMRCFWKHAGKQLNNKHSNNINV